MKSVRTKCTYLKHCRCCYTSSGAQHHQNEGFCLGLFYGNKVDYSALYGTSVLHVLDRVLLEDLVGARLKVVHQRLKRALQEIFETLSVLPYL